MCHVVDYVIVGDLDRLAVLHTTLGVDNDNTVDTLVTVECCSCGILKDVHVFNFLGRDSIDITLDTVNYKERGVVVVEGLQATHIESGVGHCIAAGILKRLHAIAPT